MKESLWPRHKKSIVPSSILWRRKDPEFLCVCVSPPFVSYLHSIWKKSCLKRKERKTKVSMEENQCLYQKTYQQIIVFVSSQMRPPKVFMKRWSSDVPKLLRLGRRAAERVLLNVFYSHFLVLCRFFVFFWNRVQMFFWLSELFYSVQSSFNGVGLRLFGCFGMFVCVSTCI